jgi:type II secretory pathway pseudopilin PulG
MLTVAIAVFVAGIVVAIAVPLVQKSERRAVATEVVEDLREFAQAFQLYFRKHNTWPPAANAVGRLPPGMETAVGPQWFRRTPIGGGYLWAPDSLQRGQRYRATIMLCAIPRDPVSNDRRLLEQIDRMLDDGDLRAGNFQLGYRDQPFFVIEP